MESLILSNKTSGALTLGAISGFLFSLISLRGDYAEWGILTVISSMLFFSLSFALINKLTLMMKKGKKER